METNNIFKNNRIYHTFLFLYDYQSYEFIGDIIRELKSKRDEEDMSDAKSFLKYLLFNSLENNMIFVREKDLIYNKDNRNINQLINKVISEWEKHDESVENIGLYYKYSIHYTDEWKEELKKLALYPKN